MKVNQQALAQEIENSVLKPGDYFYEVISAEAKPSAKTTDGEMVALRLKVVDHTGRKHTVKSVLGDWINGGGQRQIKSFFDSIGADINEDLDPVDMVGRNGRVSVKAGEFNGKPQAEVKHFIPRLPNQSAPEWATAKKSDADEDVF